MPRISQLPSLTAADNADEIAIVDVSASTTKKITRGDLLKAPLPANSVTTAAVTYGSVTADKIDFSTIRLGTAEKSTSSTYTSAVTSPAAVSGLSVTFTLSSTRRIKAQLFGSSISTSAGSSYSQVSITNGTVSLANRIGLAEYLATAGQQPVIVVTELTLNAGTYTFNVGIGTTSGTLTLSGSAAQQLRLTVDIVG